MNIDDNNNSTITTTNNNNNRETITPEPSFKYAGIDKDGVLTANRLARIRIRAIPLPPNIVHFLEKNVQMVKNIFVDESGLYQQEEEQEEQGQEPEQ